MFVNRVAEDSLALARLVNKSGEPLPKAKRVTPAKCSLKPKILDNTSRAGQKLRNWMYDMA